MIRSRYLRLPQNAAGGAAVSVLRKASEPWRTHSWPDLRENVIPVLLRAVAGVAFCPSIRREYSCSAVSIEVLESPAASLLVDLIVLDHYIDTAPFSLQHHAFRLTLAIPGEYAFVDED